MDVLVPARLEAAITALAERQPAVALDHLLAAWRSCRGAALAALVEQLDTALARTLPPLEAHESAARAGRRGRPTRAQTLARWLDLEMRGRAIDVGRLLAELTASPAAAVARRIERIELWPDDPRVAGALVAMVIACPYTTAKPALWTRGFEVLHRLLDPRGRAPLEAFLAGYSRQRRRSLPRFYERHLPRVEKLLAALPPAPGLSGDQLAAVAAARQAIARFAAGPPPTEAELETRAAAAPGRAADDEGARLLALVLAAPGDDGPRLVYGDWLQERGDPRGELIALQFKRRGGGLSNKETRRERALLRRHARGWLGAIEPVVDPKSVGFERGFVVACRAVFETERQRALLYDHPGWATVERLEAESGLLGRPALRALRQIDGLRPDGLAGLVATGAKLPAIVQLELRCRESLLPETEERLAAAAVFPSLSRLDLCFENEGDSTPEMVSERFDWLLASRAGQRLSRLGLSVTAPRYLQEHVPRPDLACWLRPLRDGALTRVDFVLHPFFLQTLSREPSGELVYEVFSRAILGYWWRRFVDQLLLGSARLAPGDLARIHLTLRAESEEPRRYVAERLAPLAPLVLDTD